jgi:hypothetical protein
MTTFKVPLCYDCLHYHYKQNKSKDIKERTCDAFKKGIPVEIMFSEHDHHKPFKGDGGIVYEENPNWREEFLQ